MTAGIYAGQSESNLAASMVIDAFMNLWKRSTGLACGCHPPVDRWLMSQRLQRIVMASFTNSEPSSDRKASGLPTRQKRCVKRASATSSAVARRKGTVILGVYVSPLGSYVGGDDINGDELPWSRGYGDSTRVAGIQWAWRLAALTRQACGYPLGDVLAHTGPVIVCCNLAECATAAQVSAYGDAVIAS
jgi:hypothetical protein